MFSPSLQSTVPISVANRRSGDVMFINHERVAYGGLLGVPGPRVSGAFSVYFSLENPFRISLDAGPWQEADLMIVPPYLPHQVTTVDRRIGAVGIEPETADLTHLPVLLQLAEHPSELPATLNRLRFALEQLHDLESLTTSAFDQLFFNECLLPRKVEHRIATVAHHIRTRPCDVHDAKSCSELVQLSPSRFLHLFTAELGVSFRRYRAWKRARYLLQFVTQNRSLTDIALDLGYPDSTHFSHSIRGTYGLRPKDIFAGSRRLAVIADEADMHAMSIAA